MSRGKCLILGFGSEALSDDGLPLRLIQDLKALESQSRFIFETSPVGGLELLELLRGYDKAVLIDTQLTGRRKPGKVSFFTPQDFEETFHLSSQHDLSFQETLRLAKVIDIPFPEDISVIAVEIVENKRLGFEFSEELEEKYPSILSQLKLILQSIET